MALVAARFIVAITLFGAGSITDPSVAFLLVTTIEISAARRRLHVFGDIEAGGGIEIIIIPYLFGLLNIAGHRKAYQEKHNKKPPGDFQQQIQGLFIAQFSTI